jgi:hypothetical protein
MGGQSVRWRLSGRRCRQFSVEEEIDPADGEQQGEDAQHVQEDSAVPEVVDAEDLS